MRTDICLLLVLYVSSVIFALTAPALARVNSDREGEQSTVDGAADSVRRLRSLDLDEAEIHRRMAGDLSYGKEAKAAILKFERAAVEPLMSVLQETLDAYQRDTRESYKTRGPIKIGGPAWILIDDCCELLGLLRALEAVPLIVVAIERNTYLMLLPRIDTQVRALIRIGKPAARLLETELQNCYQRVWLDRDFVPDDKRGESVEQTVYESQLQISAALAMIGDEETIKELQVLARSDVYMGRGAQDIIQSTIAKIRMRPAFYVDQIKKGTTKD